MLATCELLDQHSKNKADWDKKNPARLVVATERVMNVHRKSKLNYGLLLRKRTPRLSQALSGNASRKIQENFVGVNPGSLIRQLRKTVEDCSVPV